MGNKVNSVVFDFIIDIIVLMLVIFLFFKDDMGVIGDNLININKSGFVIFGVDVDVYWVVV